MHGQLIGLPQPDPSRGNPMTIYDWRGSLPFYFSELAGFVLPPFKYPRLPYLSLPLTTLVAFTTTLNEGLSQVFLVLNCLLGRDTSPMQTHFYFWEEMVQIILASGQAIKPQGSGYVVVDTAMWDELNGLNVEV